MQKIYLYYYVYIICYLIGSPSTSHAFSFKNAFNKIIPHAWVTETIYKSYALKPQGTVTLNNINGTVTVSTSSKPVVTVKATKRASKKEYLSAISIKEQQQNNSLTLTAVYNNIDHKNAYIDLEITVPHNTTLSISTGNGDIYMKKVTGKVSASAQYGSIHIEQAQSTVMAQVIEKGNIHIKEAYNTVNACIKKTGCIVIDKAYGSVLASTQSGPITLSSHVLPPTGKINLTSTYGAITLGLPGNTNADVHARTLYGTVTCQHHITIKPFTTQLNKSAWRKFRKEIEGTLGTGEAQIMLASNKNSIKILQLKKT